MRLRLVAPGEAVDEEGRRHRLWDGRWVRVVGLTAAERSFLRAQVDIRARAALRSSGRLRFAELAGTSSERSAPSQRVPPTNAYIPTPYAVSSRRVMSNEEE